jgi:folylpolyglutamate synthase/dihydropteroate synthase
MPTLSNAGVVEVIVDSTLEVEYLAERLVGPPGPATAQATEDTAGTAEIATQAEVDALIDDQRFITALKLANWAGRSQKFAQNIGDGVSTVITVAHNFNSRDVTVQVYRNSGDYETVVVQTHRPSLNEVQLVFDVAPAASAYSVVVRV